MTTRLQFAAATLVSACFLSASPGTSIQAPDDGRFANVTHRFTLVCSQMQCLEETDEVGADEIFVEYLFFDFSPVRPTVRGTVTRTLTSFDKGDKKTPAHWLYGPTPAEIARPDQTLVMAVMGEEDEGVSLGDAARLPGRIANGLGDKLALYKSQGLTMAQVAERLKPDLRANFRLIYAGNVNNPHDFVAAEPILISFADLRASVRGPVIKTVDFRGDGGRYRATFELRATKKP